MAGKTGEKITLEMIEEHLRKQDVVYARSRGFTLLVFSGSIILAGGIFYLSTNAPGLMLYGTVTFLITLILIYLTWSKRPK